MSQSQQVPDSLEQTPPLKRKRLPFLFTLAAAVMLGGGAFYTVYSDLIPIPGSRAPLPASIKMDFAYVPLDNMTITLSSQSDARVLRFSGQIEVAERSHADMERLHPRFMDLVNTYLRAVDIQDLTEPAALIRLRAQILRRLQVVAGEGHVRDFLITEFVLN